MILLGSGSCIFLPLDLPARRPEVGGEVGYFTQISMSDKPRIRVAMRKASEMGAALMQSTQSSLFNGWRPARSKNMGPFDRLIRRNGYSFHTNKDIYEEKRLIIIPDPHLYGRIGDFHYDLRSIEQFLSDEASI